MRAIRCLFLRFGLILFFLLVTSPAARSRPAPDWTEGVKTLLCIRVKYPDIPAEPISVSDATTALTKASEFYRQNSYGKLSFQFTVTPTFRLPHAKKWYVDQKSEKPLAADSRALAKAAGYDLDSYQLEIITQPGKGGAEGAHYNILFTNNESMVMTNSTGTTSNYVSIVFVQSSPTNNASCHFSIKLLGVSGKLNSPNPSTGMSGSVYPASLFQGAVMPQVTTSNVSFRGFTYSITNGFYLPLVLQPDNISLQAGGGDISVGTSTVPIFAPIPLNIQLNDNAVILCWNDPLSTFSLQTSTNITGPFTDVSGATSPYTNTITGPKKFFRLRSN